MRYVLCFLICYLIGCINPSYIFAKREGFDIRKRGSGNAGASNAIITMGKTVGIVSAVFDIVKAVAAVRLSMLLLPELPFVAELAAAACILGHIFPVFMRFRGGKGLACLGGSILAMDWRVFLCLLAVEIVLALIVNYICVVPLTASVIYPILRGLMTGQLWGALILSVASAAIIFRHVENLRRIRRGTEMRLNFLWNRDRELERIQENGEGKE